MSEPLRRVVFDANVWVSAILSITGASERAISAARLGRVRALLSEAIVSQVRLALYRIDYDPFLLTTAIAEMRALAEIVSPTSQLSVITAKDSDNRVLELAVDGRADLIVSGDRKHLLPLGAYAGIPIVTPADFVASLPTDRVSGHCLPVARCYPVCATLARMEPGGLPNDDPTPPDIEASIRQKIERGR